MATGRTVKKKTTTKKDNLFVVYMHEEDYRDPDQFIGVFDSYEKVQEEIQKIKKAFDCEISEDDFEITTTTLNKNWLL
ncbi:hypothetical protein FACS189427_08080 [Planctomycetales bacterium]|nr:hypothetical protein FACS189427_08080 [Planctomycetales bacterium]